MVAAVAVHHMEHGPAVHRMLAGLDMTAGLDMMAVLDMMARFRVVKIAYPGYGIPDTLIYLKVFLKIWKILWKSFIFSIKIVLRLSRYNQNCDVFTAST